MSPQENKQDSTPNPVNAGFFHFCRNTRLWVVFLLGISSGLPLLLTNSTLQAWFTVAGVKLAHIGWLSVIGLPYLFKFLWSPLLDHFSLPFLGRRRAWIVVSQWLIAILLLMLSRAHPGTDVLWMSQLAFFIALFSATQDIVINAYSIERLPLAERASGAAFMTVGYRIAMILSSGAAWIFADFFGWRALYQTMALLMILMTLIPLLSRESVEAKKQESFYQSIVSPFMELIQRKHIWVILLFILCYKLGDDLATALSTTFFLRELQFPLALVGVISKVVGFSGTIVGALIGAYVVARLGYYRALLFCGVLQIIPSFFYLLCSLVDKSLFLYILTVTSENVAAGMGTSALLGFMMCLCHRRYTATQFAVLTAIMAVGRVITGPIAAYLVATVGWSGLFISAVVLALPGLFLLRWLSFPSLLGDKNLVVPLQVEEETISWR